MSGRDRLWKKFSASKKYREEFVSGQLKRGIPFQIRSIMKARGISQEQLAERSGLSQGAISRAADMNYGNLTINTIIRIAAGFDVAFVGKFVPFSELGDWFLSLSEEDARHLKTFNEEDLERRDKTPSGSATRGRVYKIPASTPEMRAAMISDRRLEKVIGSFVLEAKAQAVRSPQPLIEPHPPLSRIGMRRALDSGFCPPETQAEGISYGPR